MAESDAVKQRELFSDLPVVGAEGLAFEFDGLAQTLAGLALNPGNRTPFTVVVRGDWGRGKTTLMRQAKRKLDEAREAVDPGRGERKVWTLWFNAWKYPSDETVLAGLLGALLDEMRRGSLTQQLKYFVDQNKQGVTLAILKRVAPWLPLDEIQAAERYSEAEAERAFYDCFRRLFAQAWLLQQHAAAAIRDTDHMQIEDLLVERQGEAALAIFLDDLDRCREGRVLEVMEAINLFLDLPGVCFYLGLDWKRISELLGKHEQMSGRQEAFLEKIVQVSFDLPEISTPGVLDYLRELVKGSSLAGVLRSGAEEQGADDFATLAGAIRSRHPRHVKRLLNDLSIRLAVLRDTGHLGEGDGRVPERAVLAWHLLHEVLPSAEWEEIRALRANLDGFLRRWRALQQAGARDEKRLEGVSEKVAELHSRGILSSNLEDLVRLVPQQRDLLVHLGSPPPGERATSEARRVEIRGTPDLDLLSIDGGAWVPLPGGGFQMGAEDLERARPPHRVALSPFRISRFPVTNSQYRAFLEASGKQPPRHWPGGEIPGGKEKHPVVHVSWTDAEAFCSWLTGQLSPGGGGVVQLPAEAQWEYAARGEEGRDYPWGKEEPTDQHANFAGNVGDTTPVGDYPAGATPAGVQDLAGNVWEWCRDWYAPYSDREGKDPAGPSAGECRVLRGGSWDYSPRYLRAAVRSLFYPGIRDGVVGFRVVWSSAGGQD